MISQVSFGTTSGGSSEALNLRVNLANQLEALLLDEPSQFPEPWRHEMLGMLFLKHPSRIEKEQDFLIRAKMQLEIALQLSVRSKNRIRKSLADCCFELANWNEALALYEELKLANADKPDDSVSVEFLNARITACRSGMR